MVRFLTSKEHAFLITFLTLCPEFLQWIYRRMAIGQQIQEAVESLVSYILVLDIVGYKVNFEIEMHMFKGRFLIGNHWRKTGSCGNFSHLVNPSFWPDLTDIFGTLLNWTVQRKQGIGMHMDWQGMIRFSNACNKTDMIYTSDEIRDLPWVRMAMAAMRISLPLAITTAVAGPVGSRQMSATPRRLPTQFIPKICPQPPPSLSPVSTAANLVQVGWKIWTSNETNIKHIFIHRQPSSSIWSSFIQKCPRSSETS